MRILPFYYAFELLAVVEPGRDCSQLGALTVTLRSLHQPIDKMSYLNQMYEKGNVSIHKEKKHRECSIRQVTS